MSIENWKKITISGSRFNIGLYDYTFDIFKLQELNLPYALACFKINSNEFIVVGCDPLSPRDFMSKNQFNNFMLDESKP